MTADDTHDVQTPPTPEPWGAAERICLIVCLIWMAFGLFGALRFGLFSDGATVMEQLMAVAALLMPLALIALVYGAARQQRMLRQEARILRTTVIQLQSSLARESRARRAFEAGEVVPATKSEGPLKATPQLTFSTTRTARTIAQQDMVAAPTVEEQPALQLDAAEPEQANELDHDTLISALHFPSDGDDTAGFEALRATLSDRRYRPLIYAAQDVLTRLAKDEVFMDTLNADRTRPEVWRRFADGERGPMVAAVGGVRDRTPLALASRALKAEPAFRDTAHQFVAKFDALLSEVSDTMDDATLLRLTQTRSAKAFMLLGRVLGLFS